MPRPYVVSVGQILGFTASPLTIPLPVHRENDILVFVASYRNGAVTSLSGFTNTITNVNGTHSFSVWWKRAGASESDPTSEDTVTSSNGFFWVVIRGAVTTGNPFEQSAQANRTSADPQSMPAITTTTDGAGVVGFWSTANDINASSWDLDGAAGGRPIVDIRNSGGTGVAVGYAIKATAGAISGSVDIVSASIGSVGILAVTPAATEPATTATPTVTYGTEHNNAVGALAVTLPATAVAGETILLIVASRQALTIDTPAGYHKTIATTMSWAFHKVAVGGETSVSLTHTNTGDKFTVVPALVQGTASAVSSDTTLNAAVQTGRFDVDAASTGLLIAAVQADTNITASLQSTAVQGALTERIDYERGTVEQRALWIADRASVAGQIGRVSWTWSGSDIGGLILFQFDTPPPVPPGGGGNRMGGDKAIRKPPRRPKPPEAGGGNGGGNGGGGGGGKGGGGGGSRPTRPGAGGGGGGGATPTPVSRRAAPRGWPRRCPTCR